MSTKISAQKLGPADCFISFVLLICAILLYLNTGLYNHFGFPAIAVVAALPLSFVIWGLSALVQPQIYCNFWGFITGMIFGITAMTGMFILLFMKSGVL